MSTLTALGALADPDFARDELEAASLTEVIRLRYSPTPECDICQRRPSEVTVSFDGVPTRLCDTCYQRAEDVR